jgi:quinoprotein glucose dehydrogenase
MLRLNRSLPTLLLLASGSMTSGQAASDWPTYGGDAGGQRYSRLTDITPANVTTLRPAWVYHTHALDSARLGHRSAAFESTPILFHGALYLTTPFDVVIALDPATGAERWQYDPQLPPIGEGNLVTSRGVASWDGGGQGACASRLFLGTLDARLIALDAVDGHPCQDFGDNGQITLKNGVQHKEGATYAITSAPTVVGNVVVVGSSIPDNQAVDVEMGTVRGFDVRTGRLLWAWDPIPWALGQTPRTGAGNAWSTISADPALGLIYVPTGSAAPDYYGGMRPGDNRDADSVVALDAATGRKRWAFQVVHHNPWDYDVAAEPVLFTWRDNTPAIAVTTKMGQVFVLDRRTGVPLFPVAESPVPKTDVPGETASSTQPISSLAAVGPTTLDYPSNGWQRDPRNADYCATQMRALRYEGMYTPPSLGGSVEFPGPLGGVNWGSPAFDPQSGILYANNNRYPYQATLIPQSAEPSSTKSTPLIDLYRLLLVGRRKFKIALAVLLVLAGCVLRRSWLPGWWFGAAALLVVAIIVLGSQLAARDRYAAETRSLHAPFGDDLSPNRGAPYLIHRKPILDYDGLPCTNPPWSALTAIDLNTGKKLWEVPVGTLVAGAKTGTVGLGGPIVTAGGLVFTAATKDAFLRAFDAKTGEQLWQGPLPVPAQSTPMSYKAGGKQFLVIAAGGHGTFGTPQGDSLVAFALP